MYLALNNIILGIKQMILASYHLVERVYSIEPMLKDMNYSFGVLLSGE